MKYVLMASLAGILFGFGGIALKLLSNEFAFAYLLVIGATGLVGIILFQYSLKHRKASVTSALSAGFSSIVAVLGGVYLGEVLSATEIFGILLIIFGSVMLLVVKR